MRTILLALLFVLSSPVSAISDYAKLKGQQKATADIIRDELRISEADAYNLYQSYLDFYVGEKVTDEWYYKTVTNGTMTAARFANTSQRFLRFDLINNNRIASITFIKFPESGQVFVHVIEDLPRSADAILAKQAEVKKDAESVPDAETSGYSVFHKKGMASSTFLIAGNGVGSVHYVDSFIYDLKPSRAPAEK